MIDLPNLPGAACAGSDEPDMWWPERANSLPLEDRIFAHFMEIDAKNICQVCPVRPECLTWALEHEPDMYGIWGGLNGAEREALRNHTPYQLGLDGVA